MIQLTYFVHATSIHTEKKIVAGWEGSKLSKLGEIQAKKLGRLTINQNFKIIFSSDLKRAFDTALIAFSSKYEIIQDKRLREINAGVYTNSKISDFKKIMKDHIDIPFPSGESYNNVKERISSFIEFLKQNYKNSHVAIVSHNAPQLAFEVLLNHNSWVETFDNDWRKKGDWQPGWDYWIRE
jgi:broad specificity phosphatase PhoE